MSKTTKQILIVEGKDGYIISNLLIKRGVNPPLGYETKELYKDFVKNAGNLGTEN